MTCKWKSQCVVTAFFALTLVSSAWSTPVTIVNPGFEANVLAPGAFTAGVFASGWVVLSGNAGAFHPTGAQLAGGAPEGSNTAYIFKGGTISEMLSSTLAAFTTYTLSVDIVNRSDYFLGGGYQVQLLAGGVLLAQDNNTLSPASGTFQVSNIVFTEGTGPLVGQTLEIRLIGLGPTGQPNFDAVTLDAGTGVPEPESVSLFGIGAGLLGIAMFRRRSRTAVRA